MKTNLFKNILLVGSGIILATSFAIYAMPPIQGTSIQANLTNLVQYLRELHITSDGTPDGDSIFFVDGSGEFTQTRGVSKIVNTADFDGFDFIGAINNGTYKTINGVVSLGEPSSFMGTLYSGIPTNYVSVQSGLITMTAASVYGTGYGYDLDIHESGGIFARGIDSSTRSNMTRQDGTKNGYIMRLLNDGTFMLKNYIFPLADGSSGQVMITDGQGQLSWTDAGSSSVLFTGIFVSSNQIKNMGQNPVELLPEPGPNQFIDVSDVIFKYNYGSTPYNAETLSAYFGGNPGESVFVTQYTSTLDVLQNFFIRAQHANSFQNFAEDESFKLSTQSGINPGNGDGTLEVYITYKKVDLLNIPQ